MTGGMDAEVVVKISPNGDCRDVQRSPMLNAIHPFPTKLNSKSPCFTTPIVSSRDLLLISSINTHPSTPGASVNTSFSLPCPCLSSHLIKPPSPSPRLPVSVFRPNNDRAVPICHLPSYPISHECVPTTPSRSRPGPSLTILICQQSSSTSPTSPHMYNPCALLLVKCPECSPHSRRTGTPFPGSFFFIHLKRSPRRRPIADSASNNDRVETGYRAGPGF